MFCANQDPSIEILVKAAAIGLLSQEGTRTWRNAHIKYKRLLTTLNIIGVSTHDLFDCS